MRIEQNILDLVSNRKVAYATDETPSNLDLLLADLQRLIHEVTTARNRVLIDSIKINVATARIDSLIAHIECEVN